MGCNIITFTLELHHKKSSNNEARIFIRCTQNRQHKRIATGVAIPSTAWDKKLHKVRKNHTLHKEYNQLLDEKLKLAVTAYHRLLQQHNSDITLDDLILSLTSQQVTNFYEFAYRTKMAEIEVRNKLGTYRRYEAVLNKFMAFTGKNLNINRVTYELIRKYEHYLLKELKNGRDTVSSNLSVIRAILNEAIRHGVYTQRNPFDQLQLKYTDNTKEKLTVDELSRLINTPLPAIPSLTMSRDFFLSCFLAEGTRAGDMMVMQKENIINGCLVFQQMKTGKQMVIPVVPELQKIFDRYSNDGRFLFPYLAQEKKINEVVINSKITVVNKYLKELSKYCGIFKKLSTHVARHTFTDLALMVSNGNIYSVQQSLGHSSVKTTEIYSRARVNQQKQTLLPDILRVIGDTTVK